MSTFNNHSLFLFRAILFEQFHISWTGFPGLQFPPHLQYLLESSKPAMGPMALSWSDWRCPSTSQSKGQEGSRSLETQIYLLTRPLSRSMLPGVLTYPWKSKVTVNPSADFWMRRDTVTSRWQIFHGLKSEIIPCRMVFFLILQCRRTLGEVIWSQTPLVRWLLYEEKISPFQLSNA